MQYQQADRCIDTIVEALEYNLNKPEGEQPLGVHPLCRDVYSKDPMARWKAVFQLAGVKELLVPLDSS